RRANRRVQPFGAVDKLVADRGNVVLPATGAEKSEIALVRVVLRKKSTDVAAQLAFRCQGRRQLERPLQAMAGRDLLEQLLDIPYADIVEHLPPEVWHGIRHVGVGHPTLSF